MKEKDVIRPYLENCTQAISWWYKIPDSRYSGAKPFDVIAIMSGNVPLAMEFKLTKTLAKWPYSKVVPHQEESLFNFHKAGGETRVILCIKVRLSDRQQKELCAPGKFISFVKAWDIQEFKKDKASATHFDVKSHVKECLKNVRQ